MAFNDDVRASALRVISDAPFSSQGWDLALNALATAGGGWLGQMMGFGPDRGLQFNWTDKISTAGAQEFVDSGGAIAAHNPRMSVLTAPPSVTVTDADVITDAERQRHPLYQELFAPYDVPFILGYRIPLPDGSMVVPAVGRCAQQGEAEMEDRRAFLSLSQAIRDAFLVDAALSRRAEGAALGALEALAIPAFLLSPWGQVRSVSPLGEDLLAGQGALRLRKGCLAAIMVEDDRQLQSALAKAAAPPVALKRSRSSVVAIRNRQGGHHILDVAPLPAWADARPAFASVLVAVRPERRTPAPASSLAQLAGLTSSEAEVALAIASGISVRDLADQRATSIHTVRSQLKRAFAKLDVSTQSELARLFSTAL